MKVKNINIYLLRNFKSYINNVIIYLKTSLELNSRLSLILLQ